MRIVKTVLQPRLALTYATRQEFLHYLRSLLREISYLPDPFAREYHHADILRRFRKYAPKETIDPRTSRSPLRKHIKDPEDLARCFGKCQEKLSWFYRAANGDHKALTKAIWVAYGRIGRRKHFLLKPYLLPDIPKDAAALEEALDARPSLKLSLSKSVGAILKQQARQSRDYLSVLNVRTHKLMQPVLPEKNIWGRPMPLKRVVNAKKALLGELSARILPPLPEDEFKRLQDLASGKLPCPKIPRRRQRLQGLPQLPDLEANHSITARTMRRIWAQLLQFCSFIRHDPYKRKWIVTWGSPLLPSLDMLRSESQDSYFRKADERTAPADAALRKG